MKEIMPITVSVVVTAGAVLGIMFCMAFNEDRAHRTTLQTARGDQHSYRNRCALGDENWTHYFMVEGIEVRCHDGVLTMGRSIP